MVWHEETSRLDQGIRELACVLTSDETVETTLTKISKIAVETIPGADYCGVSLVEGRNIKTLGATYPIVEEIDQCQYATGEGPCLSAVKDQQTFEIDDLEVDEQWPRFSREASGRGIQSLLSFVMKIGATSLAGLNLYARATNAFSNEDRRIGQIYAAQAAAALANAQTHERDQQKVQQLETGMRTREIIGKALGIVMEREGLSEDEAFELLKRLSQNLNVKLRDVATDVVGKSSGAARHRDER